METLIPNVDYYFENGLMVLTENYLKKRGYCCDNGCRHCPYKKGSEACASTPTETSP
ncbi:MAG: hypothetical protein JNM93_10910 [Bacteriovoracaceae bacterium]|nr:hypothetical protein [Bacteriovoracaceae bacterium]